MSKKDLSPINPACVHLMPGDVLLFPPNSIADGGWVGQAIVYFTKGEVSHSAIYCGEIDGVAMIAHAEPNGINYQSFESLLAGEPCCYIRRHTGKLDLTPVLDAVKKYTGNGNSYPFVNLGIIGLLILLNKFSDDRPLNQIVYDFALLVGVKIMKQTQERVHEGETPMMCSQFASQCYTDAGPRYDLKFDKLLLQFGNVPKGEDKPLLLDALPADENLESLPDFDDAILQGEDHIVANFLDFAYGKEALVSGKVEDKTALKYLAALLLSASCFAITGKKPKTVKEAISQFSTNRNYLVTPDDLFTNASNLQTVGYMTNLYSKTSFFKFVDSENEEEIQH